MQVAVGYLRVSTRDPLSEPPWDSLRRRCPCAQSLIPLSCRQLLRVFQLRQPESFRSPTVQRREV